jgi:hypothetical protein
MDPDGEPQDPTMVMTKEHAAAFKKVAPLLHCWNWGLSGTLVLCGCDQYRFGEGRPLSETTALRECGSSGNRIGRREQGQGGGAGDLQADALFWSGH